MRYDLIIAALSRLIMIVGTAMVVPFTYSLIEGESTFVAFGLSAITTLVIGLIFMRLYPLKEYNFIRPNEGYAIVTFGWIIVTLFGSLPFQLSGLLNFTDAVFETMSGFTTAGASIIADVEVLPRGILLWRSFTHWLGGMGIVVLYIALLSQMGVSAVQMFRAEASGPVAEKITPKIKDTAKILWFSYVIISAAAVVALWLAGMSLFDAFIHSFGAVATGGFSTKNFSLGYYSALIQSITIIFMFLGGVNFALYYQFYKKRSLKVFWQNEEFKLFVYTISGATLLIAISLVFVAKEGIAGSLLDAAFQVVSIITTTGYVSVDYEQWPLFAKGVLLILLFIGGSLGSTAGGIKIGRLLILLKLVLLELKRFSHPRSILTLRVNGKEVSDPIVYNTLLYFFVYISIFGFGTIVMTGFGLDLISAATSVAATLGVVGPGFGAVGAVQNYSHVHPLGKQFLTFMMLVGRLELFTVLVLLLPYTWRKKR